MAQIPRAALDYLAKEVNGISADAKAKVMRVLEKLDWNDVPACRDAVVSAVNAVLDAYSLAAGQASADFFDASREIAVGSRLGAAVATGRDPDATEGAIRAFVDKVLKGDIDSFNSAVLSRVGYELKRSAGQTMMENAARDPLKPRFARVPGGGETCKFCLMLASRGFVYHSKKTAGEFGHYHDNCDCQIVSSWDDDGAEGYDPDALAEKWREIERKDAGARAERNGTSAEEERDSAMHRLQESANRPRKNKASSYTEMQKITAQYKVDLSFIETRDYRTLVRMSFGNDLPDRAIGDVKRILKHRSKTQFEDLYVYDLKTGKLIDSIVNSTVERGVKMTDRMRSRIERAVQNGADVAMLHNHPGSSIPSAADFAALKSSGASFGVIACHDGSLYRYSIVGEPIEGYTLSDKTLRRLHDSGMRSGKDEGAIFKAIEHGLGVRIEHIR